MIKKQGCITRERKKNLLERLNRINGQINGVKGMVEGGSYCVSILQQISSIHEALRGAGRVIMKNYLEICASRAIQSKKKEKQDRIYNELMDIIYKYAK